jgi:hypothetical protein
MSFQSYEELLQAYNALKTENALLKAENESLRQQLKLPLPLGVFHEQSIPAEPSLISSRVDNNSSPAQKIALFMSLFKGREDVYAQRWYSASTKKSGYQPVCDNEWKPALCNKKKYRCARCPHRKFSSISESVIESHLRGAHSQGKDVIGIYPLLPEEKCHFLAIDFDDTGWQKDITAFKMTCINHGVPIAIERSRSGEGAHVWMFF